MNDANDILESGEQALGCPKCGALMETVHFDRHPVARCTACQGLFMDAMTHEHLQSMEGSESIDTGQVYAEDYDQVVLIKCPACHTPMIRMVDHRRPYIWYESCPVCFGLYLDAGEFRQQKERQVLGTVQMLHNHERL